MNSKNPHQPPRFPGCAGYEKCLASAALADIALSCSGCPQYDYKPLQITEADLEGMVKLLAAVFGMKNRGGFDEITWHVTRTGIL